jgi:serine/threonine-protein kinase
MAEDGPVEREFGPFLLRDELGRGGMGVVVRAIQPSLNREVALKIRFRSPALEQPDLAERFLSEARAAARLRHPNIVIVHEVGEAEGAQYIVMELVQGRTLSAVLGNDGALPPEQTLRIARQLASALDFAHRQGVIHRDVKPSNIILGNDDHLTLTDFGIARLAEGSVHTSTGVIVGTPAYMAPEQAKAGPVSGATDQYALACVLFEALSGQPPFTGATSVDIMLRHVGQPPPRLSRLRPELPATIDAVVARALAKDPSRRYPTCEAFVADVAAALERRRGGISGILRQPRSLAIGLGAVAAVLLLMTALVTMAPLQAGVLQTSPDSEVAAVQITPTVTSVAVAVAPTAGGSLRMVQLTPDPLTPVTDIPTRAVPQAETTLATVTPLVDRLADAFHEIEAISKGVGKELPVDEGVARFTANKVTLQAIKQQYAATRPWMGYAHFEDLFGRTLDKLISADDNFISGYQAKDAALVRQGIQDVDDAYALVDQMQQVLPG